MSKQRRVSGAKEDAAQTCEYRRGCGTSMAKKRENYLDYIPRRNVNFPWKVLENGRVEVRMENRGPVNRIAQRFFKKPVYSYIALDEFGSFVWQQIDGKASIYQIGRAVRERFGEKAEPLYGRLSVFMKTLRDQQFIVYENKIRKKE